MYNATQTYRGVYDDEWRCSRRKFREHHFWTFSLSESRGSLLTLPSAEPTNERMVSRVYSSFSERGGGRQSQKGRMKSNVMITNWLINCLFVLAEYLSEDEFLYIDVCCRIIGVPAFQNMGYHSSNKTRGLTLRITLRMTQQVQSKKEANLSKQVAEPQGRIQSLEQLLRQGKDVLTLEEAAKFMGFARKYCHFAMGGVIFPRI